VTCNVAGPVRTGSGGSLHSCRSLNIPKSLNILHILRAPVGGLFRHVQDLALEQSARGHNVGLLADESSGDSLTEERLKSIAPHLSLGVHRVAMSRGPSLNDFQVTRSAIGLIDRLNIDVLHGHGAKGGLYARASGLAKLRAGKRSPKRFYTPHGGSLHYTDSFLKGLLYMGMESVLDRMSDGLIFESRFARAAYEEGLGQPKSPTRIIANGLRPSEFDLVAPATDAVEFLFVGELRKLKGVDVLLNAIAQFTGDRAPRLVVVGDGPDRALFEKQCQDLGLSDRVRFVGAMPARRAFRLGLILVMPSRAESLPYIALEAAAAGRPVIATRVGGVPEIVWGTDTVLVPPNDAAALSAAMEEAISDIEWTRVRASRLRDSISKRFTVNTMTTSVLEFYNQALAQNSDSRTRRAS